MDHQVTKAVVGNTVQRECMVKKVAMVLMVRTEKKEIKVVLISLLVKLKF